MQRRHFMTLVGGAAAALPIAAYAQQVERMRRIGVLMNTIPDSDQKASIDLFRQALHQLGWSEGRNVQIDVRWAGGDPAEIRRHADDLVAHAPDVACVEFVVAEQAQEA